MAAPVDLTSNPVMQHVLELLTTIYEQGSQVLPEEWVLLVVGVAPLLSGLCMMMSAICRCCSKRGAAALDEELGAGVKGDDGATAAGLLQLRQDFDSRLKKLRHEMMEEQSRQTEQLVKRLDENERAVKRLESALASRSSTAAAARSSVPSLPGKGGASVQSSPSTPQRNSSAPGAPAALV